MGTLLLTCLCRGLSTLSLVSSPFRAADLLLGSMSWLKCRSRLEVR